MSKKLKVVVILALAGAVVFHYRDEIKPMLESLPFSIPFLTENSKDDETEDENKSSYEYYFKDYQTDEKSVTKDTWSMYETK